MLKPTTIWVINIYQLWIEQRKKTIILYIYIIYIYSFIHLFIYSFINLLIYLTICLYWCSHSHGIQYQPFSSPGAVLTCPAATWWHDGPFEPRMVVALKECNVWRKMLMLISWFELIPNMLLISTNHPKYASNKQIWFRIGLNSQQ